MSFDWQRLSPAEDQLLWALRAEGVAFVEIAGRITQRRRFTVAWNAGATRRAETMRAKRDADIGTRKCVCGAVFRFRTSLEDFRRCLPCRRSA